MGRKKILILIMSAVLIFMNNALISQAYNLSGCKWDSNTVYYYVRTTTAKGKSAYKKAASAWNSKTKITLKKTKNEKRDNKIVCTTTKKPNVEWDGLCKWTRRGDTLIRATIYLNRAKTSYKNASALQSVATHEFGHALGLDHRNGKCLMNPYTYGATGRWGRYKIKKPQKDEIKGVNKLYK